MIKNLLKWLTLVLTVSLIGLLLTSAIDNNQVNIPFTYLATTVNMARRKSNINRLNCDL